MFQTNFRAPNQNMPKPFKWPSQQAGFTRNQQFGPIRTHAYDTTEQQATYSPPGGNSWMQQNKQYLIPGVMRPPPPDPYAPDRSKWFNDTGQLVLGSFQDLANYRAWQNRPRPQTRVGDDPTGPPLEPPPKYEGAPIGAAEIYKGPMEQAAYDAWAARTRDSWLKSLADPFSRQWLPPTDWGIPTGQDQLAANIMPQPQQAPAVQQPQQSTAWTQRQQATRPQYNNPPVVPRFNNQTAPPGTAPPQGQAAQSTGAMAHTGIQSTPVPWPNIQAGANQLASPPGYNFGGQFGAAAPALSQMLANMMGASGQEQSNAFLRNAGQQNQAYQLASEQARANAGLGWGGIANRDLANYYNQQQAWMNPLLQLLGIFL